MELQGEASGFLAIKKPWPSAARSCWGDHTRFESVYYSMFKGYYVAGDGARRDADGYFWITGRVDDVINVSGCVTLPRATCYRRMICDWLKMSHTWLKSYVIG